MMKRTITLYVTDVADSSWRRGRKTHVVDASTGRRLGDNREPKTNIGRAGSFKDVDCKRCRRKLDALINDLDVVVFDGWTGEEAK